MGPEAGRDETFEERPALCGVHVPESLACGSRQPGIDPVELRVPALAHAQARLESLQPERKKRVFEDAEVPVDRRSRHAAIPGQTRDVHRLTMGERRHRQEPREPRQVARERLRLDLLLQIGLDVGAKRCVAVLRGPDDGKASVGENGLEVEIPAELRRKEREHGLFQGAAGEEVRPGPTQLSGARAGQDEFHPAVLDVALHFVEEGGQALDLVHPDPRAWRGRTEPAREEARLAEERLIEPLVEEVETQGARERSLHPRALPGPTGPEEEEGLLRRVQPPGVQGDYHVVILRRKMTAWYAISRPEAGDAPAVRGPLPERLPPLPRMPGRQNELDGRALDGGNAEDFASEKPPAARQAVVGFETSDFFE